ncbi:TetR/AcrR family transcriptional regulator [Ktedonobacter racemifer]|uniref:Transcriptional regulator, TetR family n=1 Tax=Ktedonobacter racemifer DSM 44963 TaxID=485913 RepID=D6U6P7_KTERA|nr:TetR/AcrR family transcriptional regulator [Ktedonobacter racemifer]EFH80658.1 transcriptional regulator, TetR family [Ktedonobacter racemifer DSM 44963]
MSHSPGDLRVRRTQKLIRDAFIALIEERGFDAITVGEVASRAMVSRTAFYRYYEDKYDLVMKLFEETVITINRDFDVFRRDALSTADPKTPAQSWTQLFKYAEEAIPTPLPYVELFEHVAEYERLYRALLGKRGSSWFVMNMRAYLADMISERLQELVKAFNGNLGVSRVLMDGFVPAQIAALLVDTITWWLEQGRPYTTRQIAMYYYHMMCSILKDVPTWE